MMTEAQVRHLHSASMNVGAHTVRHPILKQLAPEEAESEIALSKSTLEALIDAPVRHLAYPNGVPDRDFDFRHAVIARRLGFDAAFTTAKGVARTGDDLYQLPRFTPWEADLPRWLFQLLVAATRRGFNVSKQFACEPEGPNRIGPKSEAHPLK
jgi:peptidoglycan/xylan/chitin deacetylase (PgdA/CDA1 family)